MNKQEELVTTSIDMMRNKEYYDGAKNVAGHMAIVSVVVWAGALVLEKLSNKALVESVELLKETIKQED